MISDKEAALAEDPKAEVVAPLKPDEQATADKRWKEKLEYFKKIERSALKSVLFLHWEQGEFAIDLEKNARAYGNRTSKQLAEAFDVSESSIYYYRRFRSNIPKEEVDYYVEKDIGWRAVSLLIGIDSEKMRKQLVEKLSNSDKSKRMTCDQLEAEVKQLTTSEKSEKKEKGEKVDKRSGNNPKRTMDSTASMCSDLTEKFDEFMEAVSEYVDEEDEEKKKKMAVAFKEADKNIGVLAKKIEKVGIFLSKQDV